MITIVLMDASGNHLEKTSKAENRHYLLRATDSTLNYPILSELSDCDLDVFGSDDMPELIRELTSLKQSLPEPEVVHIDEIIRLAKICAEHLGYTLGFTPFGEFLGRQSSASQLISKTVN